VIQGVVAVGNGGVEETQFQLRTMESVIPKFFNGEVEFFDSGGGQVSMSQASLGETSFEKEKRSYPP